MKYDLDNKVALVTGGASGIGRAVALGFGSQLAKVVVSDINKKGGEETVAIIKEAGGEATFVQTDISKAEEIERMVNRTVEIYGHLDCAFNNAGDTINGRRLHEYDETEWDKLHSVMLKGVWLGMKYEIIQMLKQGSGVIVNTASASGIQGQKGATIYCAAKHGVVGLTKAAAFDYGDMGIRVNAICPGLILTPATEPLMAIPELLSNFESSHALGRLGRPKEVAEAVMWLCSDGASFVTGHAMFVDGGCLAGNIGSSTIPLA